MLFAINTNGTENEIAAFSSEVQDAYHFTLRTHVRRWLPGMVALAHPCYFSVSSFIKADESMRP
jgi:hypothetical protein